MKLLFTLALPVLLSGSAIAQHAAEKSTSSTTISRLIGIGDWVNNGATFYFADSSVLTYTSGRGGDLTHQLKYDSLIKLSYGADSMYHNDSLMVQYFDGSNNLTSAISQTWNALTGWYPQAKNLYYYNTSNYITSSIFQTWGGAAWVPASQNSYVYNVGTNLVFSNLYATWNSLTSTFNSASEKLYYYDVNGNQVQELDQVASGTSWSPLQQYVSTYSATNQVLTKTFQTWSGGSYVNSTKYSYGYDSATGNLLTVLYQVYNDSAAKWANTTLMIYSNFSGSNPQTGEMRTWNDTLSGGSWQPSLLYTYTYNSNGQMTSKTAESWNVTGFYEYAAGDPRSNYYYETATVSEVKNVASNGIDADVFPVPAQGMLHINVSADQATSYDITILDMAGRPAKTWTVPATDHYTATISTDGFAQGNYIVKIASDKGQTVKQITIVH